MENLDEFLAGKPEAAEAVTPEVEAAPVVEAVETAEPEGETKAERPRGPDGKFAKKDEPVMVPLQALHETRDELKALKAELEQLRQPKPQAPDVAPDIFENPDGFTGHIQNQIAQATLNTTLNLSEEITRQSAGSEVVDQAQEWGKQAFASNPALYQQMIQQRNPYGFLVEQYKKAQIVSQLDSDPSQIQAFLEWRDSQSKAQAQPQVTPPEPAIPTTLADAQSARGASATGFHVPTLDEILKR
jgi:hypothetical protein